MRHQGTFKLETDFRLQGDQPAAVRELVAGIEQGSEHQGLLGGTGSGKTLTMANVIERLNRPALVLAPNKTLAAQLYSEFKELFPNNAVEYFVSYYDYYQPEAYIPQRDIYIEKDASINEEIDRMRLATTSSLVSRQDVIVVASVSCIYGLGSPEAYYGMLLPLERGQRIEREQILRKLVRSKRLFVFKEERDQADEAITLDYVLDRLVITGTVDSVVDQILALREQIGDFGEIVYAGMDWVEPDLAKRSMELMAEQVMPRVNAAIKASKAA